MRPRIDTGAIGEKKSGQKFEKVLEALSALGYNPHLFVMLVAASSTRPNDSNFR